MIWRRCFVFLLLGFAFLIGIPDPAFADCSSPAKPTGTLEYFTADNAYKYCNGTSWVAIPIDSELTACTADALIDYDTTEKAYKHCETTTSKYQLWGCVANVCLTDGLVSHWKLDETSGTLVDSVGTNDGTAFNTPTYNVTGKIDAGMQFDGVNNEYIRVPDDASLDFGLTSFSYGGWFYPTGFPNSYTVPIYKGGTSAGVDGYDIEWSRPASSDYAEACLSDGSNTYCASFLSGAPALNTWHHMLATVDRTNNELKTYHNGVLIATTNISAMGDIASTNSLRIGEGAGYDYQGTIDDVRIYGRVLSAGEVKALFDCGVDITSNLISHWEFDESSGSTANDSVGTNDGTLYNGAAGAPNMTWLPTGGQISGTLQFDTNDADNIRIPASESLKMNGDMTVAGWIKAVNDAADTQFIFLQRGPNQNKNYYLAMNPNGWLVFGHGNGTVYEAEAAVVQVADNTWHHIAFVADAPGKGYFYVDGAGVAVNPVTMDSDIQWTLSNDSMFGDTNSSFSYQGLLDDFRLYSRALDAVDIKALSDMGPPADITSNLVSHWKLDETAGTTAADSASGHTATFASSPSDPTWHATGKIDRALDFDGTDDYIETAAHADFSLTSMTLSAWVYIPTSLPTGHATIIEHNRAGNNMFGLWKRQAADGHVFAFQWAGWGGNHSILSTTAATTDTWIHVAGTFDFATANAKIYINGLLENTNLSGKLPSAVLDDIRIGRTNDNIEPWKGRIDDLRLYSRALTSTDVKALYDLGTPPCKTTGTCTQEGAVDGEGNQFKYCDGTNWKVITE